MRTRNRRQALSSAAGHHTATSELHGAGRIHYPKSCPSLHSRPIVLLVFQLLILAVQVAGSAGDVTAG